MLALGKWNIFPITGLWYPETKIGSWKTTDQIETRGQTWPRLEDQRREEAESEKLQSHQVCKTQSKGRWQWLKKKPVIFFLLFFEGDIPFGSVFSVKMSLSWCPQNCEVSTPCKQFPFGPPSFYQDCTLAGQEESNPSIDMKRRQPCLPLCFKDFHIQYDKFSWDRPANTGTCLTLLDPKAGKATWTLHGSAGHANLHPRALGKAAKVGKTFHPHASEAHTTPGKERGQFSMQSHAQTFPRTFSSPAPHIPTGIWTGWEFKHITSEASRDENLPSLCKNSYFPLCLGLFFFFFLNLISDIGNPFISCYAHWRFLISFWLVRFVLGHNHRLVLFVTF